LFACLEDWELTLPSGGGVDESSVVHAASFHGRTGLAGVQLPVLVSKSKDPVGRDDLDLSADAELSDEVVLRDN
jgi:hypothetical protein